MNVSLTRELEQLIKKKVKSGLYHSASEVIREGLRLLEERDTIKAYQLKELKRQIAIGIQQADSGNLASLDIAAVKAEGRKKLRKQ